MYTDPTSLWSTTAISVRGIAVPQPGPLIFTSGGSFSWKQLNKLRSLFHWSTRWQIGNGTSIAFWHDNWNGSPLYMSGRGQLRPQQFTSSLEEGLHRAQTLMPNMILPQVFLNSEQDVLIWKWESNGSYSAKSIYQILISGGRISWGIQNGLEIYYPSHSQNFLFLSTQRKDPNQGCVNKKEYTM